MPASSKVRAFYDRHERAITIAFFLGGFLFDTLLIERIDSPLQIAQQLVYLFLAGLLIAAEFRIEGREAELAARRPRLAKLLHYREPAIHFLLGSLLNCYMIFYFKSASLATSLLFLIALVALILVNEFKPAHLSRAPLQIALFGLSVVSFWVTIVPVALGFVGILSFLLGLGFSIGSLWPAFRKLEKRSQDPKRLRQRLGRPILLVHAVFAGLYLTGSLPPVPLALQEIGIYHTIEKLPRGEGFPDGAYQLGYTRPFWRFWESGAQTFAARPGDTVSVFVRVFAPGRFKDELKIRWSMRDPVRGNWLEQDAIPLAVTGGRDAGFRGYTTKANYQPGQWRVQVLTRDGLEVGRIRLTITADTSTEPRSFEYELR